MCEELSEFKKKVLYIYINKLHEVTGHSYSAGMINCVDNACGDSGASDLFWSSTYFILSDPMCGFS